jgi:muconolactone delta-isomerase
MQFMTLFSWHPDKAETPAPADLREAEFEMIRGLYAAGLVRQIWLRGDAGGACAIVEAASTDEVAEKLNALPLAANLQPPMTVPLKPYSGFAPQALMMFKHANIRGSSCVDEARGKAKRAAS